MDLNTAVGHTLRKIRQDNFWTLRQVSQRVPIALGYLSDIETSKKSPSLEVLEMVCTKGLGIETSMLMQEIQDTIEENK